MKPQTADRLVNSITAGRLAAHIHRLSGVALATFLPLHFLSLGLALDQLQFDRFISWTNTPMVKISETALVIALAVHATGGARLLMTEFFGMTDRSALWIAAAFCFAGAVGLLFLMNVFG